MINNLLLLVTILSLLVIGVAIFDICISIFKNCFVMILVTILFLISLLILNNFIVDELSIVVKMSSIFNLFYVILYFSEAVIITTFKCNIIDLYNKNIEN